MNLIPNPFLRGDCFFCGASNPVGLKLAFYEAGTEPKEIICRWTPPALYKGLGRILHGGIQTGLFDEIMGWATVHLTKGIGVTVDLKVIFLKPLFVEQEIEVRCRIESLEGHKVNLSAEIRNQEGTLCTNATGTYLLMDEGRFKSLVGED